MRVQRALAASALAVVAAAALTACQGNVSGSVTAGGGQASAGGSAAGTVTTGGGAIAAGGATAVAKGPSSSTVKGHACTTAELGITAAAGTAKPGEADMRSVSVKFTNKGSASCTLNGFAGVDLTTGEGPTSVPRQTQDQGSAVTLAAGASAQFPIWFRTNPPGHTSIKVDTMTVTPPGETHSVKLNWPGAPFSNDADGGGTDTLFLEPFGYHG